MDIQKITQEEIRGYEPTRLKEYEAELRTKLAEIRMDVYQSVANAAQVKRGLKRNLARVLTVKNTKKKAENNN